VNLVRQQLRRTFSSAALLFKHKLRGRSQRPSNSAAGIWLLVCMGLAGIIVVELSSLVAPQVTAALPAAPLPEFAPPTEPFNPPPRHLFAGVAARPLFSASRRPFVPESDPDEGSRDESIAIELVGTLLTNEGRTALLQPQGQDAQWVLIGGQIAGWQVVAIERDQVSLLLEERAETVELRTSASPPDTAELSEENEAQGQAWEQEPDQVSGDDDEEDQAEG
jgi:hypothetical protein